MIISPTVENISTLSSAAAYTVILPDVAVNLEAAKTVSTARTISGGASVSIWESSIQGETIELSMTVDAAKQAVLKAIKDSGIDSWLWRISGKIYEVVFDMPSAVRLQNDNWRVTLSLTIISEVA